MNRAMLTLLARYLGLDVSKLRQAGEAALRAKVVQVVSVKMEHAEPGVTYHLTAHDGLTLAAPGTVRDKDGVEMTRPQFFAHEAQYWLWRGVGLPGELADFMRDRHEGKIWTAVQSAVTPATTPADAVRVVREAELDLTF